MEVSVSSTPLLLYPGGGGEMASCTHLHTSLSGPTTVLEVMEKKIIFLAGIRTRTTLSFNSQPNLCTKLSFHSDAKKLLISECPWLQRCNAMCTLPLIHIQPSRRNASSGKALLRGDLHFQMGAYRCFRRDGPQGTGKYFDLNCHACLYIFTSKVCKFYLVYKEPR
jgi:hypothetical protein